MSFRGRAGEIVETLSCLQETTWKDSSARFIWGKFSGYKVIRIGNDKAIGDVGVFLHSSDWKFIWSEVRVDGIVMIKLVIESHCYQHLQT